MIDWNFRGYTVDMFCKDGTWFTLAKGVDDPKKYMARYQAGFPHTTLQAHAEGKETIVSHGKERTTGNS